MNFLSRDNALRYDGSGTSSVERYRRRDKRRSRSASPARAQRREVVDASDWTDAESKDPEAPPRVKTAAGESADDEDDGVSSAFEAVEELARESGWRRADRIVSGSLAGEAASRSELLLREKSITDEALRSSLSTLLSLRPAGSHSPTDVVESTSLSSSPASNVTLRGRPSLDRRSTIMPMSSLATATKKAATPISRDESSWDKINLSSASSFEDLGLEFDSEQEHPIAGTSQQRSLLYSKPGAPSRRKRPAKKTHLKRQSVGSPSISRGGFSSEPDVGSARPDAEFLDLLQAARTFSSMRATQEDRTGSSGNNSSNASTRDLSPAIPASMSSSTNFVLSSSDSPPSRDLTSSREMARSGSATRSPSPLPLELEARLRLSREETITGSPQGEPYKPQGWWDWLVVTLGPVGVGLTALGLFGIGIALVSRSSLFRRTDLRSSLLRVA